MALIEVEVCDTCRVVGLKVTRYKIEREGGRTINRVLCDGDDIIGNWFGERAVPKPVPSRRPARKTTSTRHTTLADIEADKAS